MIKEVVGDILLTDAQVIAHGVAPNDHFDKGLALSLRENYPAMVKAFRQFCHRTNPSPGKAWSWSDDRGDQVIVNLLTQEPAKNAHGQPGEATLPNVNHAIKELVKIVKKQKIKSLAIPKVATGLGKLDWDDVRPILYNRLKGLDIPIYVYTLFRKGEKALE